ncbi:Oligopeptide ABC transporter, periplasmic oligopeptide-binding protein OppA (TC 3.A.1.5.1) [hydrothermal vent metagenome]|uniref:Oligopeptide ABC transporter, periplasmic oligopeptide-binding protein OppA (TC 3.A.1.5.1) n=1 Tax=hydrothermal vent metagenome TaxID=652676 RepID=A0A3B1CGM8_9ZZZZ
MKKKSIVISFILILIIFSCTSQKNSRNIIIGIPSDVESFVPLYAFSVEEGNVTELLYLSLLQYEWNSDLGEVEFQPMLADKWSWDEKRETLSIVIRDDVYWSDGVKCTVDDVIFSFDLYSDPDVQSRALGFFEKYYTDDDGHILLNKSLVKISDTELQIKFKNGSHPDLFEIDHPIIPKHVFENVRRSKISVDELNQNPITNGPYRLKKWDRDQAIILEKDTTSFLIDANSPDQIIFKVIPEYQIRLTQLQNGEIDLMEDIQTDDIEKLKSNGNIKVIPISGRDFDYIAWNNIDPKKYSKNGSITKNIFFGSANVRKALTHALNREAVINEYLSGYGQLSVGPVSPIFKNIFDDSLIPYDYNSAAAKKLLSDEGWKDSNGDGTIDKNGVEFAFTLHIPSGNPRRDFAASLFKNNLLAVGIDVTIEQNELGTFIDNLFAKQYDAWMAAWVVPIPINLRISWYSELEETPLNFASYQNKEVDKLLDNIQDGSSSDIKADYKKIQKIIHKDEPYSFLYWVDNIVSYNKRITKINISPLGSVRHCWLWRIE